MRRSGNKEENKRILMDLDVVLKSHDCPYIVQCFGTFITNVSTLPEGPSPFWESLRSSSAPIGSYMSPGTVVWLGWGGKHGCPKPWVPPSYRQTSLLPWSSWAHVQRS